MALSVGMRFLVFFFWLLVCPLLGVSEEPVLRSEDPDRIESLADRKFRKLLMEDEEALDEIDRWIIEAKDKGAPANEIRSVTLNARIRQRLDKVKQSYEAFLQDHGQRADAWLAYGSFLYDQGEEELGVEQWERSKALDPGNPAVWNNLANHYAHRGQVAKAFSYFEKAIEIRPDEPLYYHNLGNVVYLFRKDSAQYYRCDEQGVFDQAFKFFNRSLELDPTNFELATDIAMTYYGVRPSRPEEQLAAYERAFALARDDIERQGIQIHFARIKMNNGRLGDAQGHLDQVQDQMYQVLKGRLQKKLEGLREKEDGVSLKETPPGVG